MNDTKQTAPAPEGTETCYNKDQFTTEALKGLERSMREAHTTRWYPDASDDAAVEAGLAYRAERGILPTTLGIIVFDEIARKNGYVFRDTPSYKKRLLNAVCESLGLPTDGTSHGIGITETGECACPMCGAQAPAEILNGETLSWWVYQITNLKYPRLGAGVERGFDLEYAVTRR